MMAWMIEKSYTYAGPTSTIIDNPGDTEILNLMGASSCLPWKHNDLPVVARHELLDSGKMYTGKLDDMFIVDGAVAVSARFRDLVESFEPGVHGFVPLIMQRADGETLDGDYFLFCVQQDIDCLITDNDTDLFENLGTLPNGNRRLFCRLDEPGRAITMCRPSIKGKHLWTGGLLAFNQLFCSDQFKIALRKSHRGYLYLERQCRELDRPWVAEEQMGPLLPRWRAYVASGRAEVDYSLGEVGGKWHGPV